MSNLTKVSHFKVGDAVEHRNLGPGTVTDHDGHTITVQYQGKWAEVEGKYDDSWFNKQQRLMLVRK